MSRGPSSPTPGSFFSGSDVIDEIRRHIRTLSLAARKGEGTSILLGKETRITDIDEAALRQDLETAKRELDELGAQIAQSKTSP